MIFERKVIHGLSKHIGGISPSSNTFGDVLLGNLHWSCKSRLYEAKERAYGFVADILLNQEGREIRFLEIDHGGKLMEKLEAQNPDFKKIVNLAHYFFRG